MYAHGYHTRPDEIVLATTEYRRAYRGKLGEAIKMLMRSTHLVWIGFSFSDQTIASILREVAVESGSYIDPGSSLRHVAIMPWNPNPASSSIEDPPMLRNLAEIEHGSDLILYPTPNGDYSRLACLLSELTDQRFPPLETPSYSSDSTIIHPSSNPNKISNSKPVTRSTNVIRSWPSELESPAYFKGRAEELTRLNRWAADRAVKLIAITADVEGVDNGWTDRGRGLEARLVPPKLDQDPIATLHGMRER